MAISENRWRKPYLLTTEKSEGVTAFSAISKKYKYTYSVFHERILHKMLSHKILCLASKLSLSQLHESSTPYKKKKQNPGYTTSV